MESEEHRVTIDVSEEDLPLIDRHAVSNRRTRKAELEWIVNSWCDGKRDDEEFVKEKLRKK